MKAFSIVLVVIIIAILLVLVITQGIGLVKSIIAYVKKRKENKKNNINVKEKK